MICDRCDVNQVKPERMIKDGMGNIVCRHCYWAIEAERRDMING